MGRRGVLILCFRIYNRLGISDQLMVRVLLNGSNVIWQESPFPCCLYPKLLKPIYHWPSRELGMQYRN